MEYYIIVYKNTYDAMEAEKFLNNEGYDFRIMPTPTSITQSCGICTRFVNKEQIDKIISENKLVYKAIFFRNSNGYELIKAGEQSE